MFENHFGFIRRPFSAGPDVELFVDNESTRSAVESIEYCLRGGQGIAVVTGSSGVGKTMLCQLLLSRLREELTLSFIPSPGSSSTLGLLQSVYFGLGKRVKRRHGGITAPEMRLELIEAVRNIRVRSRGIALLVDEAHLLDTEQLEEIRILSSFTDRGQPLVRPLLCGDPSLEERLLQPELKALSQRIRSQTYLETLTRDESAEFIRQQLARAGAGNRVIFEPDAINAVVMAADGVPRCLNQLCDQSLFFAATNEQRSVTAETVEAALKTLIQLPLSWKTSLGSLSSTQASNQSVQSAAPASVVETPGAVEFGSPVDAPGRVESGNAVEVGGVVEQPASVVEFGSLDEAPVRESSAAVEFGSDAEPATFDNVSESIVSNGVAAGVDFGPLATDETLDIVDEPLDVTESEDILDVDIKPVSDTAHDLEETFRQGLPDAPVPYTDASVPYTESAVTDRYGVVSGASESRVVEPVEDFVSLKPRFDEPAFSDDLLPNAYKTSARKQPVRNFAAAASEAGLLDDSVGSQPPGGELQSSEPADASTEEALLNSCIETRRDIATMLDTLESHVSESLADRYDVVMPPERDDSNDGLRPQM